MSRQKLEETINVRVTKNEKKILDDLATKEGLNLSEYIRMIILVDMFFSGSWKAFKASIQNMRYSLAKKVEGKVTYLGIEHRDHHEKVQKLIN